VSSTIDVEVVVIGAGPIGLTTASLLADYGMRTVLVEREWTVSDEPRAISITDESLRVMAQTGIIDALKSKMLLDTGARYFGRKGQLLAEVKARTPRREISEKPVYFLRFADSQVAHGQPISRPPESCAVASGRNTWTTITEEA
jgi:2-polyprenyl-6-methoxyphenol hydroxylase-like FAD-dependent oxidoreductase